MFSELSHGDCRVIEAPMAGLVTKVVRFHRPLLQGSPQPIVHLKRCLQWRMPSGDRQVYDRETITPRLGYTGKSQRFTTGLHCKQCLGRRRFALCGFNSHGCPPSFMHSRSLHRCMPVDEIGVMPESDNIRVPTGDTVVLDIAINHPYL